MLLYCLLLLLLGLKEIEIKILTIFTSFINSIVASTNISTSTFMTSVYVYTISQATCSLVPTFIQVYKFKQNNTFSTVLEGFI